MKMNLGNYYNLKTVKLSDSYVVYFNNLKQRDDDNKRNKLANTDVWDPYGNIGQVFNTVQGSEGTKYTDDMLVEIMSCTNVELPAYRYRIESHDYGNMTYKAILPDYQAKPTLSLTIAETEDYMIEELLKLIIRRNIKHGGANDMQYIDNGWIDNIVIDVLSNDLHKPVVRYVFGLCRLVNYSVYDLSYSNDNLPEYHMTFAFEIYQKIYNPTRESIYDSLREARNQITQVAMLPSQQTDAASINARNNQYNDMVSK